MFWPFASWILKTELMQKQREMKILISRSRKERQRREEKSKALSEAYLFVLLTIIMLMMILAASFQNLLLHSFTTEKRRGLIWTGNFCLSVCAFNFCPKTPLFHLDPKSKSLFWDAATQTACAAPAMFCMHACSVRAPDNIFIPLFSYPFVLNANQTHAHTSHSQANKWSRETQLMSGNRFDPSSNNSSQECRSGGVHLFFSLASVSASLKSICSTLSCLRFRKRSCKHRSSPVLGLLSNSWLGRSSSHCSCSDCDDAADILWLEFTVRQSRRSDCFESYLSPCWEVEV